MKYSPIWFLCLAFLSVVKLGLCQSAAEQAGRQYILAQSGPFADLEIQNDQLSVSSSSLSRQSGTTHVYFQQKLNGLDIFNAVGSVHLNGDMDVIYATNSFIQIRDFTLQDSESLPAEGAIEKTAEHFNLPLTLSTERLSAKLDGDKENISINNSLAAGEIKSKLLYVADGNTLILAWNVSFEKMDDHFLWNVRIDANTGKVIDKNSWTVECSFDHLMPHAAVKRKTSVQTSNQLLFVPNSYNIFEFPVEAPHDGPRSLAISPWAQAPNASPFGWHDDNGLPGAEYTDTRGNNVFAQEDRDANNFGGYRPDGGVNLEFDFMLDLNLTPPDYEDAAITNLFYANNFMHDVLYQYGFDEAAGNFQLNNYGKGGLGNDYVVADAQDGSGTNNANFSTPPDGLTPRMQMFEWIYGEADFEITFPPIIAGLYHAPSASFGPLEAGPLSENLILATPLEACSTITNGIEIDGKIAVIDRGNCPFVDKVLNAQNANAIAAIVCNNVPGSPFNMGGNNAAITIPSVMLSQDDCNLIKAQIPTVTADVEWFIDSYTDSDLDNGIIAHEYGHGVSNRLTGGPGNTSCLNTQSTPEQMGEGWSDFLALITTIESMDLPKTGRGVGTYVLGETTEGGGIRQYKYTTDLAVNPHTYDSIKGGAVSVPHGVGSVWNAMLWEVTWNLIQKYGFDPNIYNGSGGNNLALQLVLDGMKLQPCSPGFVDGRDAILAADVALTGGANACEIWRGFAKRGLGVNANQGLSSSLEDGTEDFTVPEGCELDPCSAISITYNNETIANGTDEKAEDVINTTGVVEIADDLGTSVSLSAGWGFEIEGEFISPDQSALTINTDPCDPAGVARPAPKAAGTQTWPGSKEK